uniref:Uncharacterized protein n=1 Tax=Trichogramma kaykai TaxID=54128 RepID=A0ABD2WGP4_9HYME
MNFVNDDSFAQDFQTIDQIYFFLSWLPQQQQQQQRASVVRCTVYNALLFEKRIEMTQKAYGGSDFDHYCTVVGSIVHDSITRAATSEISKKKKNLLCIINFSTDENEAPTRDDNFSHPGSIKFISAVYVRIGKGDESLS